MARESVRVEGLEGVLNTLKNLPPELVSKNGGPVRTALRRGGVLILKEAQKNIQQIIDEPNKNGRDVSTGLAKKSLFLKRVRKMPNGQKGEAFIIAVKPNKYPNRMNRRKGRKARELQANDVLFMLENGTENRPAMPWMRPAFEVKKQEAVEVFARELPRAIDRAVKKLSKQKGAR